MLYKVLLTQKFKGPQPAPHPRSVSADTDDDAVERAQALVGEDGPTFGIRLKAVSRPDGTIIFEDGARVEKPAAEVGYII